jgi:hypothetical protein
LAGEVLQGGAGAVGFFPQGFRAEGLKGAVGLVVGGDLMAAGGDVAHEGGVGVGDLAEDEEGAAGAGFVQQVEQGFGGGEVAVAGGVGGAALDIRGEGEAGGEGGEGAGGRW